MKKMLNNRKSQVSDTLTWIVATLIIVIILLVFIYFSIALSKAKNLEFKVRSIDSEGGSFEISGWLLQKTKLAYKINDQNKGFIEEWINEKTG